MRIDISAHLYIGDLVCIVGQQIVDLQIDQGMDGLRDKCIKFHTVGKCTFSTSLNSTVVSSSRVHLRKEAVENLGDALGFFGSLHGT